MAVLAIITSLGNVNINMGVIWNIYYDQSSDVYLQQYNLMALLNVKQIRFHDQKELLIVAFCDTRVCVFHPFNRHIFLLVL